jgi:hypothetical protein
MNASVLVRPPVCGASSAADGPDKRPASLDQERQLDGAQGLE